MKEEKDDFKAKITLRLPFETTKRAKTVFKATAPENQESPPGVTTTSRIENSHLICTVTTEKRLQDIITTVEDFFEKVDLANKTLKQLEEK